MSPSVAVLQRNSATGLWLNALRVLTTRGERVSPRGIGTVELRPAVLLLKDPRKRWVEVAERKLSKRLGYLEALMLLAGTSDPALLVKAAPHYANFVNPETGRLDGAYGPRVGPQMSYIRDLLQRDPDTRQAVISIFGPEDHHESRDIPCTVSLHFMVRSGALELIVYMRSNDVWLGWPYDVVQFTVLQEALAMDLGLELGPYTHVDGSLHLYDTNREGADSILSQHTIANDWEGTVLLNMSEVCLGCLDPVMQKGASLEQSRAHAQEVLEAYEYDIPTWPQSSPFFTDAACSILRSCDAVR